MYTSQLVVVAASLWAARGAAVQGFNYGAQRPGWGVKVKDDYTTEFNTAKSLVGAPGDGFTSARLFTMRQGDSSEPIEAIDAAIDTHTSLLLGLWCSESDARFASELDALNNAIQKHGDRLAKLVVGISVGSEDLYRISGIGRKNNETGGAEPSTIVGYIKQVRDTISGTALANARVGHVDTWTAWVNGSNQAVVDACDWIGFDAYPYWQTTQANAIENGKNLFNKALTDTKNAVGGKDVWVTETGYPVSGHTMGQAIPTVDNAKKYWNDVGCSLFGSTNVWWYTLADPGSVPSFGIVSDVSKNTPLFDISCKTSVSSALVILPNVSESSATDAAGASSTTRKPKGTSSVGSGSTTDSGSNSTMSTPRPSVTPSTNPNGATLIAGSIMAAIAALLTTVVVV
ncbi:GPI-anchored cell wall beta-1,3-endoglucanase [Podospora aff. communis PSN243]|uniref:Probable glucan endo-1,3-beta-glucosidase eglC n=1 Tax=Podospora aff. communis PSN243 TaxID=3040156 RepID=A0AAV9GS03_9PEZI|nr:GPI-anchored cell wall beta-1,3-endoglucanase [Podospora aff. communis PSN243]